MHPDPDALAAAGQVALRYAGGNPNGSVADIAGVVRRDRRRARADAAPREPRAAPPAPAAPARPDDVPDARAAPVRSRGAPCQVSSTTAARSSTSTCRCRTGATARSASPTTGRRRPAAVRHHRPTLGVRPHPRRRAVQGPGAQPAGGLVVRPHRRPRRQPRRRGARPEPADRPDRHHAAGRGRRARLHHRRHVDVAVEAVRSRARGRSTATTSPTGCARTPPCPSRS